MLASAARVLVASVVGLLVVSGWWGWKITRRIDPAPAGRSVPVRQTEEPRLGIEEFLSGALSGAETRVPGNPFLTSNRPWRWRPKSASQTSGPAIPAGSNSEIDPVAPPVSGSPGPTAAESAVPVAVTAAATPAWTEPPRDSVRIVLRYQGLFALTDGTVKALIHDSHSGRSAFYECGQEIGAVTVSTAGEENVNIMLPDGSVFLLDLGQPATFDDTHYGY